MTAVDDSNDIVISGISGVFPNSDNVQEFKENLLAGNDMISTKIHFGDKSTRFGLLKAIDRFDYSFFRITYNQAKAMTVASRHLLERAFEAVLDAGYSPQEIKGKNIAVIGGIWDGTDEGDPAWDKLPKDYSDGIGKLAFMTTSRISNLLDVHGPSYPVNTACSSSIYAIDHAVKAIQRGQCEGAIVCAANYCFISAYINELSVLLSDGGNSAPFDINANGYVRAEAAGVLFLQKKQYARRIYANIIHSTTNSDGFKEEGFAYPSVVQQKQLYKQFYDEIGMDPNLISYIEAHGTGTKVGDIVEGTSIDEFFCANRKTPLKVGTLKSNMGHAEAAAALCSVIKMIIAFETGFIPPNLRFNTPNPKIKGLLNGHLEVVSKSIPLEGEYFALNSFGIGGSNGHLLLTPHKKEKRTYNAINDSLPRLITASGRTEEAIEYILTNVEQNQHDAEFIGLLHEIFKHCINGHLQRGYTILQKNKETNISKKHFSGERRPVWFVFSGMGSQWPAMGKSLINIPIFAESIRRSHQVLESKGLDLMKIITNDDPHMFENILNSFVGIAAIQIALVDLLRRLNIYPDGIVGHSVGELACAYADGCFTAEQMILAAYYRGLVSLETKFIHGTMAAVGESYEFMKNITPSEIDIACHNGPTSCTLSGPTQIMHDFINELDKKKIFVREVNSSHIAYHSRYITSAAPKFLSYLKKIIPDPKIRSEKWICTSAPEHEWDRDEVRYSSAEYHTNNVLKPVLFEESYRHIPNNAITIEIAPHGLLNAILKRSLPSTADNIPLTMKNHENNVEYLLNALGRLYEMGCDMELSHLYPPIEFPVGKSTPMISPLIKWQHDEKWLFDEIHSTENSQSSERLFVCNPKSEDQEYFRGHVIDERNLYPGFGYLWLVVETVAMIENKKLTEVSIVFENVHFENALILSNTGGINFYVSVHKLSKYFEVKGNGIVVALGKVRVIENAQKEMINVLQYKDNDSSPAKSPMLKEDFYKELRLRGYNYKGQFKNVELVDWDGNYGEVSWNNNFITFMDSMAQITLLHVDCRDLIVPVFLQKVVIDFEMHSKTLETLEKENPKFPVKFYPHHGVLHSGGIQMSGLKGAEIPRQKNRNEPIYESYQFVPYISDEKMDLLSIVRVCSQIAGKNTSQSLKIISYELLNQKYNPELAAISSAFVAVSKEALLAELIVNVLIDSEKIEETNIADEMINSEKTEETKVPDGINLSNGELPKDKSATFVIVSNIQNQTNLFESIFDTLKEGGFIITTVSVDEKIYFEDFGFNVCFSRIVNDSEKIILLNRKTDPKPIKRAILIKNDTYSWIGEIQNALSDLEPDKQEKLLIVADKEPASGILGFFNCLKLEQKGSNASCFYVMDENAPAFSLDNPFYKSQFYKNLACNVYKDGAWGSYLHLILDTSVDEEITHAVCKLEERGNLSTFKWVQGPLDPLTYENSKERFLVHVYYSSLNFKDIMLSVGRISLADSDSYSRLIDCYHGNEYCGKDENGNRVMGMVRGQGIATMVEAIPELTWRVPDSMTLEEAASIPVIYSTLIYAFFFKMRLKEGYSVLIHSGSGGIGQAAINICLHYKCNIFTTVGTPEKVKFIRKTFPQIPESHIGHSRDTTFVEMVKEQTKGEGVDVVLNSLAEDKLRASVRCVAKGGHFLEIGKLDMVKNNFLELGHFLNDISFYSVQLDVLMVKNHKESIIEIRNKLQEMLDQGIVKPINRTVFQTDEVESAFRYMASGKHTGKLLIKIRDEEQDLRMKPTLMRLAANPRIYFDKNKSYVLLGGLGGFGMELADWLILRGVRKIVMSSRTGVKNGYQSYRIKLWRSYGTEIVISTADISEESGVREILEKANSLGPVAGIFNLAMVLKDDPISKQTEETFRTVANPKHIATGHLDKLTRIMCPHLEHFVVFSSVASSVGNISQTNYAFTNSAIERICELRRADNLPGIAIQWGPIGEVGYVSDYLDNNLSITIRGFAQQRIKSCLETMNRFMIASNPVVGSRIIAKKHKIDSDLVTTVANALGIKDLKSISMTWTLPELGMDSILGIELKQILEMEYDIFLTPEELRTMTFAKLIRLKEEKENSSNSGTKLQTPLQIILNEKLWKRPILRLPFIESEIHEQLQINENLTVFVFPGFEGLALTMEPLAKNLTIQTLCFQYSFIEGSFSFEKLYDYFSSYILENLQPQQEFCLIGHSLGAAITIGVVKILEERGRKGRIWLIDGSPAILQLVAEKRKDTVTSEKYDEFLQNEVCEGIITTLVPEMSKNSYSTYLEKANSWEMKKKICFSFLPKVTKTEDIDHQMMDKMLEVLKAMSDYKNLPSRSLQSPCILIRCDQNYLGLPLDESYGLKEYFKNPVEVHKIKDVDHYSILSDPKIANVIMNSSPWKKN